MKRLRFIWVAVLGTALLSGCTSDRQFSGMVAGSSIGAMLGGSVGGLMGGWRGHDVGTIIGTLAGGAVGAAATAERAPRSSDSDEEMYADYPPSPADERRSDASVVVEEDASTSPLILRRLRFVDEGRNRQLNRRESAKIIFELLNISPRTVHNVVPYIAEANGNTHIYLSPSTRIESIRPGEGVRYTAAVRTDGRLKEGTATFRIAVSSEGGEFVTLRRFDLPTAR